MTTNIYEMNDELSILKAQMKVLTNKLNNEEIVSKEMLMATTKARISNLMPSKTACYIAMVVCGLFMPACFIYGHVYNGYFSLPFLIGTILMCLYGAWRAFRNSQSKLNEDLQTESLTQISEEVAKWRKRNAIDRWILSILCIGYGIWFVIEDMPELTSSLEHCIIPTIVFIMVLSINTRYFIRVAQTTKEILGQIDEIKG